MQTISQQPSQSPKSHYNLLKPKHLYHKHHPSFSTTKRPFSTALIFEKLSKSKSQRTKLDIKLISDYLSSKYDYFKKLKDSGDTAKLERLVSVLNFETFNANEPIIQYGEEGDKFYILLNGKVSLYKTTYVQRTMLIQEYLAYMQQTLTQEGNKLRYDRIVDKNQHLNLDMNFLMSIPPESFQNKSKVQFVIEEEEKLGEFGEGFAFGEIALLKRTKRNATIKASEQSQLVSIEKCDYNKIIKELEERRLEKEMNVFKRHYPLFQFWSHNQLIKLFNCFANETVLYNSYLYKQNEDSEYIYIITQGKFEMYTLVSFAWAEEFFSYIINAKSNLICLLRNNKGRPLKENKLQDLFQYAQDTAMKSPCQYDPLKINKVVLSYSRPENFIQISNDNEAYNDPYNLFKIKVRTVCGRDVIGIEDALEMKKRFCFVKCVSPSAEVRKVKVIDFFRVVNSNRDDKNKKVLMDIITEKKSALYLQLRKGVKFKYDGKEKMFNKRLSEFIQKIKQEEQEEENKKVPALPEYEYSKIKKFTLKNAKSTTTTTNGKQHDDAHLKQRKRSINVSPLSERNEAFDNSEYAVNSFNKHQQCSYASPRFHNLKLSSVCSFNNYQCLSPLSQCKTTASYNNKRSGCNYTECIPKELSNPFISEAITNHNSNSNCFNSNNHNDTFTSNFNVTTPSKRNYQYHYRSKSNYINFNSHKPKHQKTLISNNKHLYKYNKHNVCSSRLNDGHSRNKTSSCYYPQYGSMSNCVCKTTCSNANPVSLKKTNTFINSYDDLEMQVLKETGKNKITKAKDVFYCCYDESNCNVIQIESENKRQTQNRSNDDDNDGSNNSIKYNSNVIGIKKKAKSFSKNKKKGKESYIDETIRTKLKMKDFRFMRKKWLKRSSYRFDFG